jgi:hypothetical protein
MIREIRVQKFIEKVCVKIEKTFFISATKYQAINYKEEKRK